MILAFRLGLGLWVGDMMLWRDEYVYSAAKRQASMAMSIYLISSLLASFRLQWTASLIYVAMLWMDSESGFVIPFYSILQLG